MKRYSYTPPAARPAKDTQKDIKHEFDLWCRFLEDPNAITDYDFPAPTQIGGKDALARFKLQGRTVMVPCGTFDDYETNLRCVYLAIQSMRLAEVRGIGETIRQAYGLLPAPEQHRDPYEVMGVHSTMMLEDIEVLYRSKARRLGEGNPALKDLNIAMDQIREEKRNG